MSEVEELSQRTPDEIQSRIAHTRKSLDHKLDKLSERLDPNVRLHEVKEEVSARVDRVKEQVSAGVDRVRGQMSARAPQLYAWGAVGAVAAGAVMAVTGWRRLHESDDMYLCGCVADTMAPEPLDDGIVSGPTIEPRI